MTGDRKLLSMVLIGHTFQKYVNLTIMIQDPLLFSLQDIV